MRKWILNFIEITILVVITLACIGSIAQSTFLKNKSIFGYRNYVIASNSMYPVFEYGDVILVKEVDYNDIEINDIITYQGISGELEGKVITHEVIDIKYEDGVKILTTKGRANTGIDPEVYEEQVYGKFFYKLILISFISKIVRNELGFVLFIFIPFGILFVLEFINMVKETKRRELEKLVQKQLDELKRINSNSKEAVAIEKTICVQLEEIKNAKRDFKKMKELEKTVKIPLEDIIKNIEKLENQDHNSSKNDLECLEKTTVLFTSNDIKEEISKELKIKKKKINKENKKRKYLEKKSNE